LRDKIKTLQLSPHPITTAFSEEGFSAKYFGHIIWHITTVKQKQNMKTVLMNRRWVVKQLHQLSFLLTIFCLILLVGIILGALLKI